jgi:hypothetical protein
MSIMSHGSKNNPAEQIDKIRGMIREFIRLEVVPYELTNQEKMTFIIENESRINGAVMNGHKASNQDEFQTTRDKIRQYRIDLGIIDETGKLIKHG